MSNTEQTARDMGWRPKEEFRGDDTRWVDAETFVNRGENFIPILRADRNSLREENAAIRASLAETKDLLRTHQESVEELKRFHNVNTARQVQQAKEGLIRQLKEAREINDVDSEVAIHEQLVELNTPKAEEPAKLEVKAQPTTAAIDPVTAKWTETNAWFNEKPRLRGLAMGIAEELRKSDPTLTSNAFYAKLDEEMAQYLEPVESARVSSKVGSGRTSGGGSSPRGKVFTDLPADAKTACESFAAKLVGKGRLYPDLAAWQSEYTKQYFEGETQ